MSLSDDALPGWFFGPLGYAWGFGVPLGVVALFSAGVALVVRGRRR